MTHEPAAPEAGHPESCPWCGRPQIRGVWPSPSGDRQYRCVACGTTFFIHELPRRVTERSLPVPVPAPVSVRRRLFTAFGHKR